VSVAVAPAADAVCATVAFASDYNRAGIVRILVVNCGSSSIKYQLRDLPGHHVLATGMAERIGEEGSALVRRSDTESLRTQTSLADHEQAMVVILNALEESATDDGGPIQAVGHRVVHGGEAFSGSVLIDESVIASIERFGDLAPLHNPPNLTGIRAARTALPDAHQVAVFDTAFHATIPRVAYIYALPYACYEEYGIRRYGFHGTSHQYVAARAAEHLEMDASQVNCITCHLGNGCSMAAVRAGKCVDTSMGLTPLEGLVMGTRCGDMDPAILFHLHGKGYDVDALNDLCNKQSGLLGISGKSNDMRTLARLAEEGDDRARLAIDIFCYRVKKYIGAYSAVLREVHAIVFTGGIGEGAWDVRENICAELDNLGIVLDNDRNQARKDGERIVSHASSRVQVMVIPTDEEGVIAAETYRIVS